MSEPTCTLDEFFMTRLEIQWVDPGSDGTVDVHSLNCGFDYDVFTSRDDGRQFMLKFRGTFREVDAEEKPVGYQVRSEITGFFKVSDEVPEEHRGGFIRGNGVSILYGILRGELAAATGSFPNGKLNLPTIMPKTIVDMVEKQKEEKSELDQRVEKAARKRAAPKKKQKPARKRRGK